jgi:hypothetical protein
MSHMMRTPILLGTNLLQNDEDSNPLRHQPDTNDEETNPLRN